MKALQRFQFSFRWIVALGFLAFALVPLVASPYQLYVANLMLIYILLAVGLNFLIGYAGQLAFANGALFGIGAYATGLLVHDLHWPFALALPAGTAVTMAVGILIALPALRLRGLYLALATIAFAQFTLWAFIHWDWLTYGAAGFVMPRLDFSVIGLDNVNGIYYVSFAVTVVMIWLGWNLVRSRIGRAFVSVRESEIAAESVAIDITITKTIAFAISALYAGLAGGLFSILLGVVVPEQFNLFQVVLQFCMVVVGGLGSFWGSIIGAILLVWLPEAMRGLQELLEIGFGALLLAALLLFPGGLATAARKVFPAWREPLRRPEDRT